LCRFCGILCTILLTFDVIVLKKNVSGHQLGCPSRAGNRHGAPLPLASPQDGLPKVPRLALLGQKNSGELFSSLKRLFFI